MAYNGWTNWETWHTALLIDNEMQYIKDKKLTGKYNIYDDDEMVQTGYFPKKI